MVNLRGRDVESFARSRREGAGRSEVARGYVIEFGGAFKNLQEAPARLAVLVPATLSLIFVLVFMAFGSLSQALIIYRSSGFSSWCKTAAKSESTFSLKISSRSLC